YAPPNEPSIVVDAQRLPIEKHLDAFFREAAVAARDVLNRRNGSIGERKLDERYVVHHHTGGVPSADHLQLLNGRTSEKAAEIDEVTSLSNDSATANLRNLGPVIARNISSVDGHRD